MLRRDFLCSFAAALARSAPPNLVLILADDLGSRDLSCYGNPYFSTPNLDRLAAEGARFTDAYAASPVCSPTRASILSGRYPVRYGVTDWIPGRPSHEKGPIITPRTRAELPLEELTLAERLKSAGYRTAAIGKWHLGGDGFSPREQGFDLNLGGTNSGSPPRAQQPYFGPWKLPDLEGKPGEFLTERLTQEACSFIRQTRGAPFFLYLCHFTVHIPLNARPEQIERHRAKTGGRYNPVYAAMVESLDESVGEVLDAVDETGLRDRTMIIFTSDNGGLRFEGASKQPVTDNSPFRAGKGHLYEGGIRVPLLVRLPGVIKPGITISTPVSSIDLVPTFCELAGIRVRDVDGVSLVPLFRTRSLAERPLFWHYPHYSNQGGEPASAVRSGPWKLIEFYDSPRRELYHLGNDPGETINLVEREPAVARRLTARLHQWLRQTKAILPQRNPAHDPAWKGWGLTGAEPPTPPAR